MIILPKTKEIDESIYNFLTKFDLEDVDVMLSTDFCYYPDEYLITYAFVVPAQSDEWFCEYLRDEKHFEHWDSELWILNFFHELGHYVTIDDFTEAQMKRYYKRRDELGQKETKENYFKYFADPIEDAATSWAIDFIREHEAEIAKWWNTDLAVKINNYYKVCGVERD